MRHHTELTPGDIRAAVLAVLRAAGEVSTLMLPVKVAEYCNVEYPTPAARYDDRSAKFDARVNGTATRLADKGVIVRIKRPRHEQYGYYRTHARHREITKAEDERRERIAAYRDRLRIVRERLEKQGFVLSDSGVLSALEDLERLADRLENSAEGDK